MVTVSTYGALPGMGTALETTEKVVWFGREYQNLYGTTLLIDSTAVDAGNTPTTELRAGLLMGKNSSTGKLHAYNPDATDGTQIVHAVLYRDISMLNTVGAVEDKYGHFLIRAGLKAADLLIEGAAFVGAAGEFQARAQTVGRFFYDDDIAEELTSNFSRVVEKAADYTVLTSDNSAKLVATAAVNFTLPTISPGLKFQFFQTADANLTVTSSAGNDIVTFNDAAASSVAASTASEKIGAFFGMEAVYVTGTLKWVHSDLSGGATTVTVA